MSYVHSTYSNIAMVCSSLTCHSYDAHIHLLGYPFLDSKEDFTHNSVACDVMKPCKNDPPLTVIDLSTVTVGSLRQTIEENEYFGFPCVLNTESQLLAGFLTRKDIQFLLGMCEF